MKKPQLAKAIEVASKPTAATQEDIKGTSVATAGANDLAALGGDDAFFGIDTGMDEVTNADVTLPRYTVLQGLSPQVNS